MKGKIIAFFALSAAVAIEAAVPLYGQCGGAGYTGETVCVSGATCVYSNEWYSQCLAGSAPTTTAATSTRTSSASSTRTTTSAATSTRTSSSTVTSTRSSTTSTRASTTTTGSSTAPTGAAIYVSPSGSDSNAGTLAAPLKSIQLAVDRATAGTTIYLRAGTYTPTTNIKFTKSGTSGSPYTISNYPGERVIIDGESLPNTPAPVGGSIAEGDRGIFNIKANYWRFIGLELIHGPYGIYARDASNNVYERLVTRDNYESGVQIQGSASNNLILNLDSYGNRDPRKNGESADGLAIKEGQGTGNVVRGARLWNNVDDGLDFWEFRSPITIENSYAWGNGFNRWGFSDFQGDGNGFKLGGGDEADRAPAAHVVKNSIAFLNAAGGFVYNNQEGNMQISRNTAWNNQGRGYVFLKSGPTLTSNIAVLNKAANTDINSGVSQSGNSWQVSGSWSSNSTFVSVDSSTLTGPRASNGNVVGSSFLLPTSGAAIGANTNV